MRKRVVTVHPDETVEQAIAKAQSAKVGTLLVMEHHKLVGICTTNDFFYKIVNPTLGLGRPGIRILVTSDSIGSAVEKIVNCVNKLGIEIEVLWAIPDGEEGKNNIVIHLDTENTNEVMSGLEELGCTATLLPR